MLYADRTLKTVQGQFQKLGGVIKDGQKVIDITPGAMVTVTTVSGVYIAMSLVITAGPWANILLSHTGYQLPLSVIKMNVCYWREQIPGSYNVQHRFPCFIQLESEEAKNYIYCLLSNEYPGLMKVWTCRYHNGPETDLDKRNRQTDLLILSGLHVPSEY
ncbi:peroxisomal sarcosine oxidase-like [Oncorhynchus tshawytscha]|uniref:peroxisomal sarcosine oxidase-like n=1 Tax=Oncorhynchus tshawytscha TaxID=74940 RepID=UPI001C3E4186|nr:peroxisomal sarcosine oxidase-like [Oncorhynchus tshawytscha]